MNLTEQLFCKHLRTNVSDDKKTDTLNNPSFKVKKGRNHSVKYVPSSHSPV